MDSLKVMPPDLATAPTAVDSSTQTLQDRVDEYLKFESELQANSNIGPSAVYLLVRDMDEELGTALGANILNRNAIKRLKAKNTELLAALKDIVPLMPPADAYCHSSICSQDECAHCSRIKAAHTAIAKAEGRS